MKLDYCLMRVFVILSVLVFLCPLSQAQEVKTKAVDVGNKICPVTDGFIEDEMKTPYEYEGKIYNFCCAGCIKEFKKDPAKYITKIEQELNNKPEHPTGAGHQHNH